MSSHGTISNPMMPANAAAPDTMLSHALAYARRGWSVFPLHWIRDGKCSCKDGAKCLSPGKHPKTQHGIKDASCDQATVSRWWMKWPNAHIGLACGMSGIIAIDVDPRNGGDEGLQEFEQHEAQPLPSTLVALTGGGGQHYLYQLGDQQTIRSRGQWRKGIDLKSDGGYVVLAPSGHISGRPYAWDAGGEDDPQPLPAWLSELLAEREEPKAAERAPSAAAQSYDGKGILYHLFDRRGHIKGYNSAKGIWNIRCPWEHEHSDGPGSVSSASIWPAKGGVIGAFCCQHGHCEERDWKSVYEEVSSREWAEACDAAGVPRNARPQADSQKEQKPAMVASTGDELSLSLDRYGNPKPTSGNVATILAQHPDWAGALTWDMLLQCVKWTRPAPVIPGPLRRPPLDGELSDADLVYVARWLALRAGIECSTAVVAEGVHAAAHATEVDPLRDYLQSLVWDGVARLGTWLTDYCGAARNLYTSTVGRWWLISAVERGIDPGCQCDYTLVLQGEQGDKKSSAMAIIGGQWYRAGMPSLRDAVRAAMALRGVWIVGIDELASLKGVPVEVVKEFLTMRFDRYRQPYARTETLAPRRVAFAAATNSQQYLDDPTGDRRFWPVSVAYCDVAGLAAVREQLLAEAMTALGEGERHYPDKRLDPPELTAAIREATDDRRVSDPWDGVLERLLSSEDGPEWYTTTEQLLTMANVEMDKRDRRHEMRAAGLLVGAGLQRERRMVGGKRAYHYVRPHATQKG